MENKFWKKVYGESIENAHYIVNGFVHEVADGTYELTDHPNKLVNIIARALVQYKHGFGGLGLIQDPQLERGNQITKEEIELHGNYRGDRVTCK
tara:strand:- start:173 stop:454 length:282 start_codon:yes stop_codon:yes gene_type:complete